MCSIFFYWMLWEYNWIVSMQSCSLKYFECPTVFNFLLHQFMNHIYRNFSCVCLLLLRVLRSIANLGLFYDHSPLEHKIKNCLHLQALWNYMQLVKTNCSCMLGWKIYMINEEEWKDVTSLYSNMCCIVLLYWPGAATYSHPKHSDHFWVHCASLVSQRPFKGPCAYC
jgi:hypothetical protein